MRFTIWNAAAVEKLSFIQDTLMFSLRTLSEHPVYQQALCYDIDKHVQPCAG